MSTITTRAGKGAPLTHNEVDANFTNLNNDKYEAGDNPSFGSVTVTGIRANTISDAAGTGPVTLTAQSAAKAWVNFNGTGTIAIRDSFNVSSLTDNGTGNYSLQFTSNMSNTNYPASGFVSQASQADAYICAFATTAIQVLSVDPGVVFADVGTYCAIVQGDLA